MLANSIACSRIRLHAREFDRMLENSIACSRIRSHALEFECTSPMHAYKSHRRMLPRLFMHVHMNILLKNHKYPRTYINNVLQYCICHNTEYSIHDYHSFVPGSTRYVHDRCREVGYKYIIFEVHCCFCDVHVSIDL
jgi:hypothetical protein